MSVKSTTVRLFSILALVAILAIPSAYAQDGAWTFDDTQDYLTEFGEPYSAIADGMVVVLADSYPEMLMEDGIEPDWGSGMAMVTNDDGSMSMMPMMVMFDPHALLTWLSELSEGTEVVKSNRGSRCIKEVSFCDTSCQGRSRDVVIWGPHKQCEAVQSSYYRCRDRKKTVCKNIKFHRDNCQGRKLFGAVEQKEMICS